MEPIAELEDDEDGFDYDSPSGSTMNNNNNLSSRNMDSSGHGFRSRSNTWPQFSSLAYDDNDLGGDPVDDDAHELTDLKDDTLGHQIYSIYHDTSSPYHHHQEKSGHLLSSIEAEQSSLLYNTPNHLQGSDYAGSRSELSSSTSASSTNQLALLKANPAAYFASNSATTSPSLSRASNHFTSSRNDELLDTGSPPCESSPGINGAHVLLGHGGESGAGSGVGGGSAQSNAASVASALKKNTSRRNAWGNMSYADLITQAINGSPEKRLTLSQIYEWMVQNVTYFKDKGDSNSSAGWKNSIRHNLSLHNRFMRVQNEGTGKSSWWMINPDAKPGKAARRRAISMETHNYEKRRGRVKRRVEQLRAAAGLGPTSGLSSLSEYSLKSSEPSLHKLTGSTNSLLSPQTSSLSNLCLADSGPNGQNPLMVTSPSSAENFDPFSDVGHFHSNAGGRFSPGEFRPRASSNASSTCSTHGGVNLLNVDNQETHQVSSLSPHAWSGDMRGLYNSTGSNYPSSLDQASGTNGSYRNSANQEAISQLQLINCLANLGTDASASSSAAHNYRQLMAEDELHKSGQQQTQPIVFHGPAPPPNHHDAHSDMIILGPDLVAAAQAAAAQQQQQQQQQHNTNNSGYNDLYKQLQSTTQSGSQPSTMSPSTASPPSSANASSKFTSLENALGKSSSTPTPPYFKSTSLIEPNASGKIHEINNNSGSTSSLYEASAYGQARYADQQGRINSSTSLTNLAYQHSGQPLGPGKVSLEAFMYQQDPSSQVGCYGTMYSSEMGQFGYYHHGDYPGVSHEALSTLGYVQHVTGGDIDLDFDTVCSQSAGMLECDVDQVIRHELSVEGSLDFGLPTSAERTNADSSTTSSSTTPTTPSTTSCSQNNSTYRMRSTEQQQQQSQKQSESSARSPPSQQPSASMDISYEEEQRSPTYYTTLSTVSTGSNNPQQQSQQEQHSSSVAPLRPSIIYGPYSPPSQQSSPYHLMNNNSSTSSGGHFRTSPNHSAAAAAVAAAAAETAVNVTVTSPVTVSGHHQSPVASSRSWVH